MSSYQGIIDIIDHTLNKSEKIGYINMLLVYMGLRRGAILENVTMKQANNFYLILKEFPELKPIPYQRVNLNIIKALSSPLISYEKKRFEFGDNYQLGIILGYDCSSHADNLSPRVTRNIVEVIELDTNLQIYAQNCDPRITQDIFHYMRPTISYNNALNSINDNINRMNITMEKYNFPYRFKVSILVDPGLDERLNRLLGNDYTYLQNNMGFYINDLYNGYFPDSKFIINENTVYDNKLLFKFIYYISNNEMWNSEIIESIGKDLEVKLFSSDKSQWYNILIDYRALDQEKITNINLDTINEILFS